MPESLVNFAYFFTIQNKMTDKNSRLKVHLSLDSAVVVYFDKKWKVVVHIALQTIQMMTTISRESSG